MGKGDDQYSISYVFNQHANVIKSASIICLCLLVYSTKQVCPQGYFCPPGFSEAQACPRGTYGDTEGLTSQDQCRLCDPGKYCPELAAKTYAGKSLIGTANILDIVTWHPNYQVNATPVTSAAMVRIHDNHQVVTWEMLIYAPLDITVLMVR